MTAEVLDLGAARDRGTRLREAGWEPKERLGKRIWRCPDGWQCWYSEEIALEMLRREGEGEE